MSCVPRPQSSCLLFFFGWRIIFPFLCFEYLDFVSEWIALKMGTTDNFNMFQSSFSEFVQWLLFVLTVSCSAGKIDTKHFQYDHRRGSSHLSSETQACSICSCSWTHCRSSSCQLFVHAPPATFRVSITPKAGRGSCDNRFWRCRPSSVTLVAFCWFIRATGLLHVCKI